MRQQYFTIVYNRLLLSSAISDYQKGNYKASFDSIQKLEKIEIYRKSDINTKISKYLYKGKLCFRKNEDSLAIANLKKVDSISIKTNKYHLATSESYSTLIDYYREKNDTKKQLFYIDKLLKADSVLMATNTYLLKSINSKYTTPNLLMEKENIIKSLEENDLIKRMLLLILSLSSLILVIALYRNNKKKKIYRKRIAQLGQTKKRQSHTIDNKITEKILDQLSEIESSTLFLNKDFNLNYLAKRLNTNTSYLSKIINKHKGKSFKQYLTELRINTLIKSLDVNPVMRKYSIEALAESIGYNNASSFTRIFKNYIGESPSSFLDKKYPERKH